MPVYATAIIAASTCDIPAELIDHYHLNIIPQIMVGGDRQRRDRMDIQPDEFNRHLAACAIM